MRSTVSALSALGPLGPVIAPPEVTPHAWVAALADRGPLALAPDGTGGWFGGTALVAYDPFDELVMPGCRGESLRALGDALERVMRGAEARIAVGLAPYSGSCRVALYRHGVVRGADGWRAWGDAGSAAEPAVPPPVAGPNGAPLAGVVRGEGLDQAGFEAAVDSVREAIARGDVYVLNLTRRLAGDLVPPGDLFSSLAATTPAPMAAFWSYGAGAGAVVSVSPERFVRLTGHEAEIAPIKGTRPRATLPDRDAALAAELSASEKERAEHVMIVDLERNDLGRICVPGSIEVDPLFRVETTPYCHQAFSVVRGLLSPDASPADVIEATFPCGSVTGAPKVAAMRIIDDLESSPRGAYTGSLFVALPGLLDSSVLIRTVECDESGCRYGTGCGVTIDSDPRDEWEESVLKTRPVLGQVPAIALKETCRVAHGRVPLWPYHRERLRAGGCGEELLARVERIALMAAAESPEAETPRARLTVVVEPDGTVRADVARRLSTLDVPRGPVVARVDVGDGPAPPATPGKPADRSWWDAAHRAARAQRAHQAVLVGAADAVLDGSTACVWIVEDGVAITPPSPPAMPSVSRAFVMAAAERGEISARVEPVTWERFEAADEAFLTNAFGGAVNVRGRGGPVSAAVAQLFARAWR